MTEGLSPTGVTSWAAGFSFSSDNIAVKAEHKVKADWKKPKYGQYSVLEFSLPQIFLQTLAMFGYFGYIYIFGQIFLIFFFFSLSKILYWNLGPLVTDVPRANSTHLQNQLIFWYHTGHHHNMLSKHLISKSLNTFKALGAGLSLSDLGNHEAIIEQSRLQRVR